MDPLLNKIKTRIGIADAIKFYDEELNDYIEECRHDLITSGVPEKVAMAEDPSILTAITLFVKEQKCEDPAEAAKYHEIYLKKVFRLTLEE